MLLRLFYSPVFPGVLAFLIIYRPLSLTAFLEATFWPSSSLTHRELIHNLHKNRIIKDERIKNAMLEVDRDNFMHQSLDAYSDRPQPSNQRIAYASNFLKFLFHLLSSWLFGK